MGSILIAFVMGLLVTDRALQSPREKEAKERKQEYRHATRKDRDEFFGKDAVEIVRTATRVDAFRIHDGSSADRPDAGAPQVVGHLVFEERQNIPARLAKRARALVLDPRSYGDIPVDRPGEAVSWGKLCTFAPGIAFRFVTAAGKQFDVLLCITCGDLGIAPKTGDDPERDERTVDISPSLRRFIRLAAETFPKDETLRSLR